jgi:hypothetical protein
MQVNKVKEVEEVKEKQITASAGKPPFGRDDIALYVWGDPPPPP